MKHSIPYTLLLLAFASCTSSHEPTSQEHHQFSVKAQMAEPQEADLSRAVGNSVIRLSWEAGDKVSVVNVTTGMALGGSLSAVTTGLTSLLTGELTGTIHAGDKLAFVYPAQDYTAESTFTPIEIDYSEQTTSSPSLVMVAHHIVSGSSLSFENLEVTFEFLMSFMRLNLSTLPIATPVQRVTIHHVNDHITLSVSGNAVVSSTSSVKDSLTFTASDITVDPRGALSILRGILASPKTDSRHVTVTTATSCYSAYFNNAALKLNKYYYSSITGFIQPEINFADAAVKAKCLELFDKNADDKLTYLEAAAVTDLGVATRTAGDNPFPKNITSFAELQYFSGLQALPSFEGYDQLQTVAIPAHVTSLPDNAFKGCSALETAVFTSDTPPTLGSDTFSGCNANLKIYVPTNAVDDYKTALPEVAEHVKDIADAEESIIGGKTPGFDWD